MKIQTENFFGSLISTRLIVMVLVEISFSSIGLQCERSWDQTPSETLHFSKIRYVLLLVLQ